MSKPTKFEYKDLPKSAVVNNVFESGDKANDPIIDEKINEVVAEHLTNLVEDSDSTKPDNSDDDKVKSEKKEQKTLAEEKPTPSEENDIEKNADHKAEDIKKKDKAEDLDNKDINNDVEDKSLDQTPNKSEEGAADNNSKQDLNDLNLAKLLKEKLELIIAEKNIDSELAKISAQTMAAIAKKLHLILPADFEKILTEGLIQKLATIYKEGHISLRINPDKYDFCTEILQSDKIDSKFKDKLEIIKDESLKIDDCVLEWDNTKLEYNQEQLSSEVEKIIEQLKSAT